MDHRHRCGCPSHFSISRRRALIGAVAAVGAGGVWPGHAVPAKRPEPRLSAGAAWQSLQQGNARYAANEARNRDHSVNRMALVQGQQPIAAVLGCADSRVSPELLFDQSPGDIFVTRVAGNFCNVDSLASLEYAIEYLGTSLVFVLGHSQCGAVGAAIKVLDEDLELPGHLPELVQALFRPVQEARRLNTGAFLETAIDVNVRHQAARITSMSPVIGKYVASGEVQVLGGVYEIATGWVRVVS